jgi:phosphoribosylanthranilate isomerase
MILRPWYATWPQSRVRGVPAELKFCGMTRAADVADAAALGAQYVGVIFAGGPRHQSVESAARVLSAAPPTLKRVGVVAAQTVDEIAELVRELGLHAVQLHADPDPGRIRDVKIATGVDTWAVLRLSGATLPATFREVVATADAIVLDAHVPSGLGGTGVALPWLELARTMVMRQGYPRLVLAGGLRPENVGEAIAALEPDVVDVSSGIESAPGIKDRERMRAFRDAVLRAEVRNGR